MSYRNISIEEVRALSELFLILGLIAAIPLWMLALGGTGFGLLATVIIAEVAVLSFLFRRKGETDSDLLARIRSFLFAQTRIVLLGAVLVWSGNVVALVVLTQPEGRSYFEIVVESETGEIVEGATVRVIRGARVVERGTTDAAGRFRVPIDFVGEEGGYIDVIHSGRRTRQIFSQQSSQPVVVRVQDPNDLFRARYVTLSGVAAEALIRGYTPALWEPIVGQSPFIVSNDVTGGLVKALNEYRYPVEDMLWRLADGGKVTVRTETDNLTGPLDTAIARTDLKGNSIFAGAATFSDYPSDNWVVRPLTASEVKTVLEMAQTSREWTATLGTALEIDMLSRDGVVPIAVDLFGYLSMDLIRYFAMQDDPYFQMIEELAQGQETSRLLMAAVIGYDPAICGDIPERQETYLVVVARQLEVHALALENVTSAPIRLDSAYIRREMAGLGKDELSSAAIGRWDNIFPLQLLAPGEVLLVPLGFNLALQQGDTEEFSLYRNSDLDSLRSLSLPHTDSITARVVTGGQEFSVGIPTGVFNRLVEAPMNFSRSPPTVAVGPRYAVDSVLVEDRRMDVRTSQTGKLVLQFGLPHGSCPFVFTYDDREDRWVNRGAIIAGRSSPLREGGDLRSLNRHDGRVLIREVEPETSYLDYVALLGKSSDGRVDTLHANDPRIKRLDGTRLILEQGEEILIDFGPAAMKYTSLQLLVYGYYVPYREAPIRK